MLGSPQIRAALLALLTLGVAAGCSKADSAPPVASVSVTLNRTSVALGGVLELTYRFQVEPDAKLADDYVVFAHLNREDGTTIWNDDHPLPEGMRTSQWKPGQIIEYTRTRFIPTFSYIGPATLEVGLYRDDVRLPLKGPNPADRETAVRAYRVATLDLLPRTSRIQIYRLSGWYAPEYASDDPAVEWQWTQKVASFSLRNPKQDVTLFIEYDVMNNLPDAPQQVSIWTGDAKVGGFTADAKMPTSARIPIAAAQLGTGEMAEFRLEVDRTFVPARLNTAGHDTRDLGIRVFHLHVEPR
jgi:hypothetical protein